MNAEALDPPIANRGVYPPSDGVPVPQFDWYGATVCAHPSLVLDHIEQAFLEAGETTRRADGGPVRHYGAITFIQDAQGRKLAAVKHGGAQAHPHAESEGPSAVVLAKALRSMPALHFPTRIDCCIDLSAPGLFARVHEIAQAFEARFRLHLNYAGAALDNDERGTTFYLGSRKSQVFVRGYQKGLQLAERAELPLHEITDEIRNWVRLEVVFRPQKKPAKALAASISPSDTWGVSQWTADFAKDVLSIDAKRINMSHRRDSDHIRALRAMSSQYRQHIALLLRDCQGDYAEAMAVIVDLAGLSDVRQAA